MMRQKRVALIQLGIATLGGLGWLLSPFVVPLAGAGIAGAWFLSLLTVLAQYNIEGHIVIFIKRIYDNYWLSRFLILFSILGSSAGVISFLFTINRATLLGWVFLGVFVMAWPWLFAISILLNNTPGDNQIRRFMVGVVGTLILIIFFLILLEGFLQVIFPRLPTALVGKMPQAPIRIGQINYDTLHGAREYAGNQPVDILVDRNSGDLYYLTCLTPEKMPLIEPYRVQYVRDEHGFRNPMPWTEDADLVVIGDSFTAAEQIERPYWMDMTTNTLAFGLPGSGNLEQGLLLDAFGLPRKPEVVVVAFFEGNDLTDNWEFFEAQMRGESIYQYHNRFTPPWDYLVTFNIVKNILNPLPLGSAEHCIYPVQDVHGNLLAFLPPSLALATISEDALQQSDLFAVTRRGILDIAQRVHEHGAAFVVAFLPTKAHAYWPGLVEADQIVKLSATTAVFKLGPYGVAIDDTITDPEEIATYLEANIDAQRNVLANLAEENGFYFFDLTPFFQRAAAEGPMLYFDGDTHWNQPGHDVAKQALSDFLVENRLLPPESFQED